MECYYHPNKEGVNTCAICGKSVCEECSLEIAGKMYCKECLEKIVGIGLNNKTDEKKETQNTASEEITERPEPVRLGKKEEPNIYQEPQDIYEESIYQPPKEEKAIFASDLSSNLDQNNESIYASDLQKESQVYNNSPQPDYYPEEEVSKAIAEDSPYNIKGMDYSKEINETPKSYFKKESAPYLEPSNNINQDQSMGQNIVENQQQTLRQQPQSAQNEFDYYPQEQIAPQQQAPQDYIYPDHTYEPEETSARKALEEKYERYLDDLYFDETEVPLEEQLAKDMKLMLDKNIIDNNTTFIICEGHGNTEKRSASILIDYLKKEGLTNKIIISDKYISNPEILRNIDKLVDITKYNRILRIAKDFVARRWYMNAKKYNFPIEKCDFYGVVDNRNISKKDWYKSEIGINQVMKEFINIGQLTIDKELDIN